MPQTSPTPSRDVVGAAHPNEWLSNNDVPTKRWKRPSEESSSSRRKSSGHHNIYNDTTRCGEWLGGGFGESPSSTARRKAPIRIEGAKSIKDSPFFR